MGEKWTEKDIPDLAGKVIIITGANSGIGFQNSIQFTRKHGTVIIACRNIDKGQKSLDKLKKKVPDAQVELSRLDLASLASIKEFVETFKQKYNRLDVLLNNAGIMMVPYGKTLDGFESQIGTNHLGHFALTAWLFDVLKATEGSRIVNVSSSGHRFGEMDFNDFLFEQNYGRVKAYGRSKFCNLLFTYELDRKLRAKEINVLAVASHPGTAKTGLGDHLFGPSRIVLKPIVMTIISQSAYKGSLPSARAATDPQVQSGDYYGSKGLFGETRGSPQKVQSNEQSHNVEDAKKLWVVSEQLTGINFTI